MSRCSSLIPTVRKAFSMSAVKPTEFHRNFVNMSKIRGIKLRPISEQSING